MFGSDESFEYYRCVSCGCLQIGQEPQDMAKHYPAAYYSYEHRPLGVADKLKIGARTRLGIEGPRSLFSGKEWFENGKIRCVRDANLKRSDRILDIGCGSGDFLSSLADVGFKKIVGVDPYLPSHVLHANGAYALKGDTSDFGQDFDVVMMHHSLEHVWDQNRAAEEMFRLLVPGGRCIVRVPTIDCWAFEHYTANWVQLDAPRHFYLHSRKSVASLLQRVGFRVERVVDDAMAFQILGSEKLSLGLSLLDADGGPNFDLHLSPEVRSGAWARTHAMNMAGRGDSIAIHAVKPL